MEKIKRKFENVKMPHTYVILMSILIIVSILTYIIPSGQYTRVEDEVLRRTVVVPNSFEFVEGKSPNLFDIFLAIQKGYVSSANILFLIIFAYSFVNILVVNGTLNTYINALIKRLDGNNNLLIVICVFVFGILGSTLGIFEEVYGLIPVFIQLFILLGYDRIVGGSIVFLGVATGFSAATTNPFSIGIAKELSGLPVNVGIWYRIVVFIIFQATAALYIIKYANKIYSNPELSLFKEDFNESKIEESLEPTKRHFLSLISFIITIVVLLCGTAFWDWYIDEIAAWFLMMAVIAGAISGWSANKICKEVILSTKDVISSVLVVGFTRGIIIIMNEALISDTVVYYLSTLLNNSHKIISANIMLFIQNVINFFVTGSSSQATLTLPIMLPVSDLIGLNREIAIIAYIFGDGFSDIFWPTACILQCGLMGIPIDTWYKFVSPLFLIMTILQIVLISIAVYIF
ncbi:YfcC family protein [Peptoniphilus grossensis]|uniref:YfcC family protein n=1 Tax=Peptoniphilus grossensis TaxID=1465756 RepID=UPI0002EAF658|nr:YfcC family protein [Peptoniphilus grossensis]